MRRRALATVAQSCFDGDAAGAHGRSPATWSRPTWRTPAPASPGPPPPSSLSRAVWDEQGIRVCDRQGSHEPGPVTSRRSSASTRTASMPRLRRRGEWWSDRPCRSWRRSAARNAFSSCGDIPDPTPGETCSRPHGQRPQWRASSGTLSLTDWYPVGTDPLTMDCNSAGGTSLVRDEIAGSACRGTSMEPQLGRARFPVESAQTWPPWRD